MTIPFPVGEASSQGPTLSSVDWWSQVLTIVDGGTLTSNPAYYADGDAQAGEWANVIIKAFERTEPGSPERSALIDLWGQAGFLSAEEVASGYWQETAKADLGADLLNLQNAAEARLPLLVDVDDVLAIGNSPEGLEGIQAFLEKRKPVFNPGESS